MFYARINKIKVFNNREGFLGLFNRSAELRIYSYVLNPTGRAGHFLENAPYVPYNNLLAREKGWRNSRKSDLEPAEEDARITD
jgi:hypothetical protein